MLPGFAFKGVVIGGGYATGRELAEFFLVSGPQGGAGMLAVFVAPLLTVGVWQLLQSRSPTDAPESSDLDGEELSVLR